MAGICVSQVINIQTQMYMIIATVNFGTLVLLLYESYSYLEKREACRYTAWCFFKKAFKKKLTIFSSMVHRDKAK